MSSTLLAKRLMPKLLMRLLGLLVVLVACFVFLAVAWFEPGDPSLYTHYFFYEEIRIQNPTGKLGAHVAGVLFYQMGWLAYLLPLFMLAQVIDRRRNSWRRRLCEHALAAGALYFLGLCFLQEVYPYIVLDKLTYATTGASGLALYSFIQAQLGRVGVYFLTAAFSLSFCIVIGLDRWLGLRLQAGMQELRRMSWVKSLSVGLSRSPQRSKDPNPTAKQPSAPSPIPTLGSPFDAGTPAKPSVMKNEEQWPSSHAETREHLSPDRSPLPARASPQASSQAEVGLPDIRELFEPPEGLGTDGKPDQGSGKTKSLRNRLLAKSVRAGEASRPELQAPCPKDIEELQEKLLNTLSDFKITGEMIGHSIGPVVTVFHFKAAPGTKQATVIGLCDDLALALKVDSLFVRPMHGKSALGIEVPNPKRQTVYFREVVTSAAFAKAEHGPLVYAAGKSITGEPMVIPLSSMPHLLIAGATGSGKSVAIHGLIASVLLKGTPSQVKLILVDPKMLELSIYKDLAHLLMPVITDPKKASAALHWAIHEMERRYRLMEELEVRNIEGFNEKIRQQPLGRESVEEDLTQADSDKAGVSEPLPYILIVIDELADLMLTAAKDVETSIQRLAQKARASGIHMVLATQRPSVDIITGVIKANLPARMSFRVVSKHDSRTILDAMGAERLLGKGDMLFQHPVTPGVQRVQGAYMSDEEIAQLTKKLRDHYGPARYATEVMDWIKSHPMWSDDSKAKPAHAGNLTVRSGEGGRHEGMGAGASEGAYGMSNTLMEQDEYFEQAVELASGQGAVSASGLQRNLKIGYNRASRIVEDMERRGMVAPTDGVKPRKWLGGGAQPEA